MQTQDGSEAGCGPSHSRKPRAPRAPFGVPEAKQPRSNPLFQMRWDGSSHVVRGREQNIHHAPETAPLLPSLPRQGIFPSPQPQSW